MINVFRLSALTILVLVACERDAQTPDVACLECGASPADVVACSTVDYDDDDECLPGGEGEGEGEPRDGIYNFAINGRDVLRDKSAVVVGARDALVFTWTYTGSRDCVLKDPTDFEVSVPSTSEGFILTNHSERFGLWTLDCPLGRETIRVVETGSPAITSFKFSRNGAVFEWPSEGGDFIFLEGGTYEVEWTALNVDGCSLSGATVSAEGTTTGTVGQVWELVCQTGGETLSRSVNALLIERTFVRDAPTDLSTGRCTFASANFATNADSCVFYTDADYCRRAISIDEGQATFEIAPRIPGESQRVYVSCYKTLNGVESFPIDVTTLDD